MIDPSGCRARTGSAYAFIPGRKKYAPPDQGGERVNAGRPLCTLRIGLFGTVKSIVQSWVPDDRVVFVVELVEFLVVDPHVLRELELTQQSAQMMNAAMPRSTPSSGAPSGSAGPYVAPRRIIRRRFM